MLHPECHVAVLTLQSEGWQKPRLAFTSPPSPSSPSYLPAFPHLTLLTPRLPHLTLLTPRLPPSHPHLTPSSARSPTTELMLYVIPLFYTLISPGAPPNLRRLFESYIFYEAIHARGYFSDSTSLPTTAAAPGPPSPTRLPPRVGARSLAGLNQSVKQLRFYARFIIVCLLLNKKEVGGGGTLAGNLGGTGTWGVK